MKYFFFLLLVSSTVSLHDACAADSPTGQAQQVNPLEAAYAVARSIDSPFLRTTAFVEVGSAFHQAGEAKRSKDVFDEAYFEAKKTQPGWRDVLIVEIVGATLRAGNLESAVSRVSQIEDPHKRESCRSGLALEYARQGKIKEAYLTVQSISDSATRTNASVDLGSAFAQAGMYDQAYEVSESMKSSRGKAEVFSAVGERQLLDGKPEKAFEAFLKIDALRGKTQDEFAVSKVRLLAAITEEYRKRGDHQHTKEMLDKMARISEQAQYDEIRAQVLFDAAMAYYQAGEEDKFLELLNLSVEAAETTRDMNIKVDVLVKAFFWYNKIGNSDESYRIKFALLELAQTKKAELQTRNLLLSPSLRRNPYRYAQANEMIHIAQQLLVLGDEENSQWFVNQLDDRDLPEGYARLAEIQLNLKMTDKAKLYLDKANKFTSRVNWETDVVKSESLERIASLYAKLGDGNKALEVAGNISNPFYRVKALSQIGVVFANQRLEPDNAGRTW
ncbi:MAG: hypothetical protein HGB11_09880, partial [Chlorobiales bacterium]|nr:hypothetical protein [Chlorobiales bacterium]